jgi:hypothetical protein
MQHQDLNISGLIDYGAQVRTVSFAPHIAFVCDAAAGSNIDSSNINSGNCTWFSQEFTVSEADSRSSLAGQVHGGTEIVSRTIEDAAKFHRFVSSARSSPLRLPRKLQLALNLISNHPVVQPMS